MNPSIHASQHVSTLRQTHRAATTLLPVLTATLTVAGAVIAALEARAPQPSAPSADPSASYEQFAGAPAEEAQMRGAAPAHALRYERKVTLGRYLATLIGRVLLVALGIALVAGVVYLATTTGRTGQAVLLTALVLLALYLTEKVARRA